MSASARDPGEVFLDARGGGRAMRLTWHHEADLVVLSLWRDHVCAGTFRLTAADVNDFVDALVDGLHGAPGVSVSRTREPAAAGSSRADPLTTSYPPKQRTAGSHAARTPDRAGAAPHAHRLGSHPEAVAEEQETFTDWAFGAAEPQRATTG